MKISSVKNKFTNIDIIAALIFLSLLIIVLYWRVNGYDFVSLDDSFIYENKHLKDGLNIRNIFWAFSNTETSLWIPVTWISFFIDYEIYGMNAGGFHLTNVLLHIFNTALLFIIVHKITAKKWPSFFVAALFSCHPMHVESVAWVIERKDVLSTFFLLLFLFCYVRYTEKENIVRYLVAMFFFLMGLMSKPMLVTVPLCLILFDYWPLGRFKKHRALRIILEKIPFLYFSLLMSTLTILFQIKTGALVSLENIDFIHRTENAILSYIVYLVKLFFPAKLAVVYPYEHNLSQLEVSVKFIIFILITTFALRMYKKHPYFIVGWLWYVISLLPVIGIFQSGAQAYADRFVYIPFIGIYIILAWGTPHFLKFIKTPQAVSTIIFFIILPILGTMTWFQIGYWKNSNTLYAHTLSVTENNWLIQTNYGKTLEEQGKEEEANIHFEDALNIKPEIPIHHLNFANNLYRLGKIAEAEKHYKMAITVSNDKVTTVKAHNRLAFIYQIQKKNSEAIKHYKAALRIDPNQLKTLNNLAILLAQTDDFSNAAINFNKALELSPHDEETLNNFGLLSIKMGNINKGITYFKEALRYNPAYKPAQNNLARYMTSFQAKKQILKSL